MWRTRAIVDLLIEEVAGLAAETDRETGGALRRARRRARLVALLDLVALSTLFVLRDRTGLFLPGEGTEAVFTLGVVAVAAHAGFRLAQAGVLDTVARVCAELEAREPEG